MGLRTVWELRGHSCLPLEQVPPPKKGIASSRSFGRPVENRDEIEEALASYVSQAAAKLRGQKSMAAIISVSLGTNPFKEEPQYHNFTTGRLPTPTAYTAELIRQAHRLLRSIYRPGYRYKKTGVLLSGIMPAEDTQLNLFEPSGNREKHSSLMETVDMINTRWGKNSIQYAAEGIEKRWHMRQARLSDSFTTRWEELPVVKASRMSPNYYLDNVARKK